MDKLRALRYFLKVAETSSFSSAAAFFSVPVSSVSRRIRDLEAELQSNLFYRSTRVVKLTEIGELYYEKIATLIQNLDDIDDFIGQGNQRPSGILRISVMPGFARMVLYPLLDRFQTLYPDIILDLDLSNQLSDVSQNEVDIAIRATAHLPDRVVAKKLCENNFRLVASPEYLDKHGIPQSITELDQHNILLYRGPNGVRYWQAQTESTWTTIHCTPKAISNDGIWLLEATKQGKGLCLLPSWGIQSSVQDGSLCEITLNDAKLCVAREGPRGVYLLYLRPRYSIPKLKIAIDFLMTEISALYPAS